MRFSFDGLLLFGLPCPSAASLGWRSAGSTAAMGGVLRCLGGHGQFLETPHMAICSFQKTVKLDPHSSSFKGMLNGFFFRGPLSEWIMATPLIICCWKLPENWLIAHVLLWSHSPASETEKDEDQRTHRLSSRTSRTSRTGKSVWQGGLFHDEAQAPLHKLANWTMKAHDERWAAPLGKKGWTQKDQKGSSWVGKAQISGGLALEKLRVAAV